MEYKIEKLKKMSDERGYLIEFLKRSELEKEVFGQNYFVTFGKKGVIRGNHYHKIKSEWFVIAFGKAEVRLIDLDTKEEKIIVLSDDNEDHLVRLFIGPNIAHSFKSLTNKAVLLNYTDKEYTSDSPDTYFYEVTK